MEVVEHLITIGINNLGRDGADNLTKGILFVAQHYNDLLSIIRWTFPCVIMGVLLLCFLVTSKKAME